MPSMMIGDTLDQPRIRGEKVRPTDLAVALEGSTPHTRGKDLVTCEFQTALLNFLSTCTAHASRPQRAPTTSDTVTSPVLT